MADINDARALFANILGNTPQAGGAPAADSRNYLANFNPRTLRQNAYFLDDLRKYYASKGIVRPDDQLFDLLFDDANVRNWNTFAPFIVARGSWADAADEDPEGKARMARLKQVTDMYPQFWQEGGEARDFGDAARGVAKGILTDPVNYLTLGFGAAAGAGIKAIQAAARGGTALSSVGRGAAAGAKGAAVAEAAIGGVTGAISSYGNQATNVELGLQEEVSGALALQEATMGAILSGALGGLLGGVGGAIGGVRAHEVAGKLVNLGYTPDDIATMTLRQAKETADAGLPSPALANAGEVSEDAGGASGAEGSEGVPPTIDPRSLTPEQQEQQLRMAAFQQQLREYHAGITNDLQNLTEVMANEDKIAETRELLARVRAAIDFGERMRLEREQIDELLSTNDPKSLAEGRRRAAIFEQELADYQNIAKFVATDDIDDLIVERLRQRSEQADADNTNTPDTEGQTTPDAPEQAADQTDPEQPAETAASSAEPAAVQAQPEEPPARPAPKARPQVLQFALDNGIDIANVAPTGARGFVTKADIEAHIEANGPSDDFAQAQTLIDESVDFITNNFSDDVVETFQSDPALLTKFIQDRARAANPDTPDTTLASIDSIIQSTSRVIDEGDADGIPAAASNVKFDRSQYSQKELQQLRRHSKQLLKENPDMPEILARQQAEAAIFRAREQETGKKQMGRTSAQRAAENIYEGAGRTASGRLQSFLRRGATFADPSGGEYSITGRFSKTGRVGDVPSQRTLAYEEAVTLASSRGQTVQFTVDQQTPVVDRVRAAEPGETVFIDGKSGKAFADLRNLYAHYGMKVDKLADIPSFISPSNPNPSRRTPTDLIKSAGDRYKTGEISLDQYSKIVQQATERLRIERERGPSPELPPLKRGNDMALFRHKTKTDASGSRVSFMATKSDLKAGRTAQDIIGAASDIRDFDVFYVPPNTPNAPKAREVAAAITKRQPDPQPVPSRSATKIQDYYQSRLADKDLTTEDWSILESAAQLVADPRVGEALSALRSKKSGLSGKGLDSLISQIEAGHIISINAADFRGWPATVAARNNIVRILTGLYDLQTRIAPNGIARPEGDRMAAKESIEKVFAKYGTTQIKAAKEAIDQLAGVALPDIRSGQLNEGEAASTFTVGVEGNTVGRIVFGDLNNAELPQIAMLYHEIAHWAYAHVMTPGDRLDFWNSLTKYYREDGTLDLSALARRSPIAKVDGRVEGPRNALMSPQEFFANQFSMWAMQNRAPADARELSLWQKFARYVKAIFDRYFSKAAIDPDLEPVFARILPERERLVREIITAGEETSQTLDSVLDDIADAGPSLESVLDEAADPAPAPSQADPRGVTAGPSRATKSLQESLASADADPVVINDILAEDMDVLEFMNEGSPALATIQHLKVNYERVSDLEQLWDEAVALDDPMRAIEAAKATMTYLRGSALPLETVNRILEGAARKNATGKQPTFKRGGIYTPYKKNRTVGVVLRNKLFDLTQIVSGRDVEGIPDFSERDINTLSDKLISQAVATFGEGETYRISGNVEEIGERLIAYYSRGKIDKDGNPRPRTSVADALRMAKDALNVSAAKAGKGVKRDIPDSLVSRLYGVDAPHIKLGHFSTIRVGDGFVSKTDKRGPTFVVEEFRQRDDGTMVAVARNLDNNDIVEFDDALIDTMRRHHNIRGEARKVTQDQVRADARKAVAARKAEKKDRVEKAVSAATSRKKPKAPERSTLATAPSTKAMSATELENVIADNRSATVDAAAQALVTKRNTAPVLPTGKTEPRVQKMSATRARDTILEGFLDGDADTDNYARSLKPDGQPILLPKDAGVIAAIDRELREDIGDSVSPGVPLSAPATMREALMGLTHRDGRLEYVTRTIAYRILSLLAGPSNSPTFGAVQRALNLDLDVGDVSPDAPFTAMPNDPTYVAFRDKMREMAKSLSASGDFEQFIRDATGMFLRATGEIDAVKTTLARGLVGVDASSFDWDEVAVRWMEARINFSAKNGTHGGRRAPEPDYGVEDPDAIGRIDASLASMLDRIGYVANGFINDEDYYRFTWYDDMLRGKVDKRNLISSKAVKTPSEAQLVVDVAAEAKNDALAKLTRITGGSNRIQFIPAKATQGDLRHLMVEREGDFGSAIYLRNSATFDETELTRKLAAIQDTKRRAVAQTMVEKLQSNRAQIQKRFGSPDQISSMSDQDIETLNSLLENERVIVEVLNTGKYGLAVDGYAPVAVKLKTPFVMDEVVKSREHADLIGAALARGAERAGERRITPEIIEAAVAKFSGKLSGKAASRKSLGALHSAILLEAAPKDPTSLSKNLARVIRAAGYDSVITPTDTAVFDRNAITHINADTLDVPDFVEPDTESSGIGQATADLAYDGADEVPQAKMSLIFDRVAQGAPSARAANLVANIGKRRLPTVEDEAAVLDIGMGQISANSNRVAKLGMHWIADWFDNHFPNVTQKTALLLYGTRSNPGPLRVIQQLPDASGFVKGSMRRWLRASTADGLNITPFGIGKRMTAVRKKLGLEQPASHKRIVTALRRADRESWSKLSDQEKAAAQSIRAQFRRTLEELNVKGAMLGNLGENYFPQVWKASAIRGDADGFKAAMSSYLMAESSMRGKTYTIEEAGEIVNRMYATMSDESAEAIFKSAHNMGRSVYAENLDYNRLINLRAFPKQARALEKYLEDDLETILVKYYDAAGYRITELENFGPKSHGFYDYLRVVEDGVEGVAHLLSTPRIEKREVRAVDQDTGDILVADMGSEFAMPLQNRPPSEQRLVAQEVIDLFNSHGEVPTRELLMRMAVPHPIYGPVTPMYEKRVDAILGALRDFGGRRQQMTVDTRKYLENIQRLSNRRNIADTLKGAQVSKRLRQFNSISLLGWTLLSSLGDTILPIVRSGDMKAAFKALNSARKDPDYRAAIANLGVAMESLLHQRMTALWGSTDGQLTNAFFSGTGLSPWTDTMRQWAAMVGLESFAVAQQKALRAYNPNLPIGQQSRTFKVNRRVLDQYGLGHFATDPRSLRDASLLETDTTLRTAVIKFADKSVFSPNPNEMPVWTQTPLGAIIWQLKSFPMMMGRMAHDVLYKDVVVALYDAFGRTPPAWATQGGTGDLRRGAMMLTLAPLMGAGVLSIKDLAQGRGGESSDPQHAIRERSLAKWAGVFGADFQPENEELDAIAGWYVESLLQVGGFGLVFDMVHDTVGQLDNGAYGKNRTMQLVFGPSMGAAMSAWDATAGAADAVLGSTGINPDAANSNAKERAAVREVARRIPILGGYRPFVEGAVNTIAGESGDHRANKFPKF